MRIALAQINPSVGAIDDNLQLILSHIEQAKKSQCELIVFPELAICGYCQRDLLWQQGFLDRIARAQEKIRQASGGIGVILGGVTINELQSCSKTTAENEAKQTLFNTALFFFNGSLLANIPKTHLSSDDSCAEMRYFAPGPGAQVVDCCGKAIGINVGADLCEDDGPTQTQASLGAEWIINISASPFLFGKQDLLRRISSQQAKDNGLTIFYVNLVGGQDQTVLEGGSFVTGPTGKLLYQAPSFVEGLFTIDTDKLHPITPKQPDYILLARQAIVLGIRDYLRKSGFSNVIIGISGGIDSAVVAALAVEALGPSAVTGVYLPSEISSAQSQNDAHLLSNNLGIEIINVPISQVVTTCHNVLSQEITGLAAENLQARVRAVLLMALANQHKSLVLTTGNKSEIAVGYNTLYGDTIGALAPIGDLYKTQVWHMAKTMEDVIPRSIIEKKPSAELRPNQTDEEDLPPYDVLDPLLKQLIEKNASREHLLAQGFAEKAVDEVLYRYFRNEYKRRQLPPALKLSESCFGEGKILPINHQYTG